MSATETQDIKEQLNRIERCLVGDPEMGQLGLVARTNNHAGRIKRLEMWVFRIGVAAAVSAGVVGLIYKVATDWWPKH